MIVITGPGRSGTSFLASVYREVGVDPGGSWEERVSAGLEDPAVTALNDRILSSLGVTALGAKTELPSVEKLLPGKAGARLKRLVPEDRRKALRRRIRNGRWNQSRSVSLLTWRGVDDVTATYAEEMTEYASTHVLVKDPRFSWTLPVWLRSGASISHIIITTRDVNKMVDSRQAAEQLAFARRSDAINAMIYALGVSLTSSWDAGVPTLILRFPDFLSEPTETALALPKPTGISADDLARALRRLADPSRSSVSP